MENAVLRVSLGVAVHDELLVSGAASILGDDAVELTATSRVRRWTAVRRRLTWQRWNTGLAKHNPGDDDTTFAIAHAFRQAIGEVGSLSEHRSSTLTAVGRIKAVLNDEFAHFRTSSVHEEHLVDAEVVFKHLQRRRGPVFGKLRTTSNFVLGDESLGLCSIRVPQGNVFDALAPTKLACFAAVVLHPQNSEDLKHEVAVEQLWFS